MSMAMLILFDLKAVAPAITFMVICSDIFKNLTSSTHRAGVAIFVSVVFNYVDKTLISIGTAQWKLLLDA